MTKRYYWLKLKEDFFDDETIQFIEEQENGIRYSNFYLKLCLKSLKTDGKLIRIVGENLIPYDIKSLSRLTNVDIDTVKSAMDLFIKIGLVRILETGEIYLSQIDELVGCETDKAHLMRRLRAEEKAEKENKKLCNGNNVTCNGNNVTKVLPKCYTEYRDRERYKDIEDIEKDIDINNMIIIYNWDKNEKCDCLTRKNEKCIRRSTYNINGKNYCNQHSKEIIKTNIKTLEEKEKYFENEEVNNLFEEFLKIRKKIKAVNSELAIKKLINKLNKYEDNIKIQMLENSIVNSWKDVYEIKQKKETQIEKLQREIREAEEEERKQKNDKS